MRVFISWSGDKSLHLARLLHMWLPNVIQDVEPFLSEEDIKKGARWSSELANKLRDCNFGIVCATPQSIASPWVLYEAGAISKILDESSLVSILFGVNPADLLHHPLEGFQSARIEKQEILKVLESINARLGEEALEKDRLVLIFEKWWGDFDAELKKWIEQPLENLPINREELSVPVAMKQLQTQMNDLIQSHQELGRLVAAPDKLLPPTYIRSLIDRESLGTKRQNLDALMRIRDRLTYLRHSLVDEMRTSSKDFLHRIDRLVRDLEWDVEDVMRTGGQNGKRRWKGEKVFIARDVRGLSVPTQESRSSPRESATVVAPSNTDKAESD